MTRLFGKDSGVLMPKIIMSDIKRYNQSVSFLGNIITLIKGYGKLLWSYLTSIFHALQLTWFIPSEENLPQIPRNSLGYFSKNEQFIFIGEDDKESQHDQKDNDYQEQQEEEENSQQQEDDGYQEQQTEEGENHHSCYALLLLLSSASSIVVAIDTAYFEHITSFCLQIMP